MKKVYYVLLMTLALCPITSEAGIWQITGNWDTFESGSFLLSNYQDKEFVGNTGLEVDVEVEAPITVSQLSPLVTDISSSIIDNSELNTFNVIPGLLGINYSITLDFGTSPLTPGNALFIGGLGRLFSGIQTTMELTAFFVGGNITDTLVVAATGKASGFTVDMAISGLGTSLINLGTSGSFSTVGNSEFAFFTSSSPVDLINLDVQTLGLDAIHFGVAIPEPKTYMVIGSTLILALFFMRIKRANIYTR